MFLRNYEKLMFCTTFGGGATYQKFIKYDGTELKTGFTSPNMLSSLSTYTNAYGQNTSGVLFGTGNAEPTFDDYKLSGEPISGLTVSATVTYAHYASEIVVVYTITNGNSESVTIGEIAIKYSGSNGVLMERTKLDNPVTIEPNGVGVVTYTISRTPE